MKALKIDKEIIIDEDTFQPHIKMEILVPLEPAKIEGFDPDVKYREIGKEFIDAVFKYNKLMDVV